MRLLREDDGHLFANCPARSNFVEVIGTITTRPASNPYEVLLDFPLRSVPYNWNSVLPNP
jgi:hypothetical protein